MDQRFRRGHKFEFQSRDRSMEIEVFPEGGRSRVEPGLCPAILLGLAVRISEDQVLGNLA